MRSARVFAASKLIRDEFAQVVAEYTGDDALVEEDAPSSPDRLDIEIEHVDGTYNAKSRNQLLDWLKADAEGNTARILTNARCLSEGGPTFLLSTPSCSCIRASPWIDVRAVRGARHAPRRGAKRWANVILPWGVPAGVEPLRSRSGTTSDNRVVWQILNALPRP